MKKEKSTWAPPPADPRTESVRRTIHAFLYTDRLHRKAVSHSLGDLGIHPTQHRILAYLRRYDGMVSQKTLSEEFDISPAAVAVTLGKLEKNGYIRRTAEKEDGRCKRITVTEAGEELLRVSYDSFTAVDLAMFEDFSEEELAAFRDRLLRVQAALTRLLPDRKENDS